MKHRVPGGSANQMIAAALGLVAAATSILAGSNPAAADPRVPQTGASQPIESVVQRALSQRGVPFVYGGGNVDGPTAGARQDSPRPDSVRPNGPGPDSAPASSLVTPVLPSVPGGIAPAPGIGAGGFGTPGLSPQTVGFDSSGLIQYAFAAAGIKMPRTSREQCAVGVKVPPAQARRGDLLCYGPNGSQSVALYLGRGQMIEGTEPAVTVSPARTSNMVPYLTRVIA